MLRTVICNEWKSQESQLKALVKSMLAETKSSKANCSAWTNIYKLKEIVFVTDGRCAFWPALVVGLTKHYVNVFYFPNLKKGIKITNKKNIQKFDKKIIGVLKNAVHNKDKFLFQSAIKAANKYSKNNAS